MNSLVNAPQFIYYSINIPTLIEERMKQQSRIPLLSLRLFLSVSPFAIHSTCILHLFNVPFDTQFYVGHLQLSLSKSFNHRAPNPLEGCFKRRLLLCRLTWDRASLIEVRRHHWWWR